MLVFAVPIFTLNNWASSFMHIATVSFTLWALCFLRRGGHLDFAIALFFAVLAALSSGSGVLVFFVAIPLVVGQYSKFRLTYWSIAGLVILIYYFIYGLVLLNNKVRASSALRTVSWLCSPTAA